MNFAPERWTSWTVRHPRLVLGILLLVFLGPFLNKAVHIDDPLFVWSAEWIAKHPGNFYGFDVNWTGVTTPMYAENCNPPLQSYFLAGIMAVLGEREFVLHGAVLLVTFAAMAGIFQLARLWCARPLLATLIAVCTPVFLVSATSLMCDVPMLALWVWALVFWEEGMREIRNPKSEIRPRLRQRLRRGEKKSELLNPKLLVAGVLAGLAVLTKYSAITLLPVLALVPIARSVENAKRITHKSIYPLIQPSISLAPLLWLLVPVGMIAAYQIWTARLYGQGLISAASDYAARARFLQGGVVTKSILGLIYSGGCLPGLLFFAPALWSGRRLLAGSVLCLGVAFTAIWGLQMGDSLAGCVRVQMVIFMAIGLGLVWLTADELWRKRDAVTFLLAAWVAGQFLFAAVLNWTVSARAFLPMVPAVAILMARKLDDSEALPHRPAALATRGWMPVLLLIPGALISLFVAIADYDLANSGRLAARQISDSLQTRNNKVWFQGHRGYQFYLQRDGGLPVDQFTTDLARGDTMIIPSNGNNIVAPSADEVASQVACELKTFPWICTVHGGVGAGFYGGGYLPYAFVSAPAEKYFITKVLRPLRYGAPEELNDNAWEMATTANRLRNEPGRAVQLAQRACELSDYKRTMFVGTLGAAYADAGRFDEAVAAAEKACALAVKNGETNLLLSNQKLMEAYKAHQPVRANTK